MEIYKTIKKKANEYIGKHNLDEIRETIEAPKCLKLFIKTHAGRGGGPDDNTHGQTRHK